MVDTAATAALSEISEQKRQSAAQHGQQRAGKVPPPPLHGLQAQRRDTRQPSSYQVVMLVLFGLCSGFASRDYCGLEWP